MRSFSKEDELATHAGSPESSLTPPPNATQTGLTPPVHNARAGTIAKVGSVMYVQMRMIAAIAKMGGLM